MPHVQSVGLLSQLCNFQVYKCKPVGSNKKTEFISIYIQNMTNSCLKLTFKVEWFNFVVLLPILPVANII